MDGAPWHSALDNCFRKSPSTTANTGHLLPAMVVNDRLRPIKALAAPAAHPTALADQPPDQTA